MEGASSSPRTRCSSALSGKPTSDTVSTYNKYLVPLLILSILFITLMSLTVIVGTHFTAYVYGYDLHVDAVAPRGLMALLCIVTIMDVIALGWTAVEFRRVHKRNARRVSMASITTFSLDKQSRNGTASPGVGRGSEPTTPIGLGLLLEVDVEAQLQAISKVQSPSRGDLKIRGGPKEKAANYHQSQRGLLQDVIVAWRARCTTVLASGTRAVKSYLHSSSKVRSCKANGGDRIPPPVVSYAVPTLSFGGTSGVTYTAGCLAKEGSSPESDGCRSLKRERREAVILVETNRASTYVSERDLADVSLHRLENTKGWSVEGCT